MRSTIALLFGGLALVLPEVALAAGPRPDSLTKFSFKKLDALIESFREDEKLNKEYREKFYDDSVIPNEKTNACPGNLKDADIKLVYAHGNYAKVQIDKEGNRDWIDTRINHISDLNAVTFEYHVYGRSGAKCGKITAGTKLSTHWTKGLGYLWAQAVFSEDMEVPSFTSPGFRDYKLQPISFDTKQITPPEAAFIIASQSSAEPSSGYISIELMMHPVNSASSNEENSSYRLIGSEGKSRKAVLVDALTGIVTVPSIVISPGIDTAPKLKSPQVSKPLASTDESIIMEEA